MAKRSVTNWGTGYTGSTGGAREPLTNINRLSNDDHSGSETRRSLPKAGWVRDEMDRNSPREKAMSVRPQPDFYLDCDDKRSR